VITTAYFTTINYLLDGSDIKMNDNNTVFPNMRILRAVVVFLTTAYMVVARTNLIVNTDLFSDVEYAIRTPTYPITNLVVTLVLYSSPRLYQM
jgi:hypothetical protein